MLLLATSSRRGERSMLLLATSSRRGERSLLLLATSSRRGERSLLLLATRPPRRGEPGACSPPPRNLPSQRREAACPPCNAPRTKRRRAPEEVAHAPLATSALERGCRGARRRSGCEPALWAKRRRRRAPRGGRPSRPRERPRPRLHLLQRARGAHCRPHVYTVHGGPGRGRLPLRERDRAPGPTRSGAQSLNRGTQIGCAVLGCGAAIAGVPPLAVVFVIVVKNSSCPGASGRSRAPIQRVPSCRRGPPAPARRARLTRSDAGRRRSRLARLEAPSTSRRLFGQAVRAPCAAAAEPNGARLAPPSHQRDRASAHDGEVRCSPSAANMSGIQFELHRCLDGDEAAGRRQAPGPGLRAAVGQATSRSRSARPSRRGMPRHVRPAARPIRLAGPRPRGGAVVAWAVPDAAARDVRPVGPWERGGQGRRRHAAAASPHGLTVWIVDVPGRPRSPARASMAQRVRA